MSAIQIDRLSKRFGKLSVLKNVCVEIPEGEVTAIVGPNGSGKTTLIKCVLGLVKPDSGDVVINGKKINGDDFYRQGIGYMPQIARLPENLNVKDIITMIKDLRGVATNLDEDLMRDFNLQKEWEKKLGNLSGGTRQKVTAAIAFLFKPNILILDEPTAGLDPIASALFKDKILREKANGKTIILTSHIVSEIEELAGSVVFLLEGEKKFDGKVDAFLEQTSESRLERAIAKMMLNGKSSSLIEAEAEK
jgi:Cu-processing system ATP-binding protein